MAEVYGYVHLTASGAVKGGSGVLHSLVLSAAGADATATVYDETVGSGDVMAVATAVEGSSVCAVLDVAFGVGCYVVLAGTGATATVAFR